MEPEDRNLPALPGWPRDNAPSQPPGLDDPAKRSPLIAARADGPTLTQQMRSVQPPDVARQAIGELGVLARELDAVPESLIEAGLAAEYLPEYREVLRDYVDLSHYAWEAVAEEQLEHAGAEPAYRQRAVNVARGIMRLEQAAAQVKPGDAAQRRARVPLLMRRRVKLVRAGLVRWQMQLVPVPDPQAMGRALFALQGYVSLATAGALELVLLDLLISLALALTGLLAIGTALLLVAMSIGGTSALVLTAADLLLASLLAFGITILLTTNRIVPLELLLGAMVFARRRSACLGWEGSPAVSVLLRAWWVVIGALGVLSVPLGMALGGVLLAANEPFPVPGTPLQMVQLTGNIVYLALVLPAAASFAALIVLVVPFGLVATVHFAREMAANPYWVPKARRYSLRAVLAVVIAMTILLLGVITEVGALLGWQHIHVFSVSLGMLASFVLSVRGLVLILGAALPYLLLVDLPYRIGMSRWKSRRLADLDKRRADLESQVRRLATQEPSDELLRAMQYDLVLLQFYKSQADEAQATRTAPFRIEGTIIATGIGVVGGLLIDGLGGFAVHLLQLPH